MQIEIIGDMCIGRDERTGCHRLLGSSYTDLSTQSSIKCIFTTCTEQKKDLKRIPQSGLSKRNFIKRRVHLVLASLIFARTGTTSVSNQSEIT